MTANTYALEQDGTTYNLALLPDVLAVYTGETQQFYNAEGARSLEDLRKLFPDKHALGKAAALHNEVHLDESMVRAALLGAYTTKRISAYEMKEAIQMVLDCKCPPDQMKDKLVAAGFNKSAALIMNCIVHAPEYDRINSAVLRLLTEGAPNPLCQGVPPDERHSNCL